MKKPTFIFTKTKRRKLTSWYGPMRIRRGEGAGWYPNLTGPIIKKNVFIHYSQYVFACVDEAQELGCSATCTSILISTALEL